MATARKLKVEILTAERLVYEADQVDEVIVPGAEGELAAGGFMEVVDNEVRILSDIAEREEEIDIEKAREARDKAQAELEEASEEQYAAIQAALQASLLRLRVAERRRRRSGRGGAPGATP
jgi:F-type H+-transporting ATPase subunit epsilon